MKKQIIDSFLMNGRSLSTKKVWPKKQMLGEVISIVRIDLPDTQSHLENITPKGYNAMREQQQDTKS